MKKLLEKVMKFGDNYPKLFELLLVIAVLVALFSIFLIIGRLEYVAIEETIIR